MTIKARIPMMITTNKKNLTADYINRRDKINTMTEHTRRFILDLIDSERKERDIVSKRYSNNWSSHPISWICCGAQLDPVIHEIIVRHTRFYFDGTGNDFEIIQDIDGNLSLQVEGNDAKFTLQDIKDDDHDGVRSFLETLSRDVETMLRRNIKDDKDDSYEYSMHALITNTLYQLPHMGWAYIGDPRLNLTKTCLQRYVAKAKERMENDLQHTQV